MQDASTPLDANEFGPNPVGKLYEFAQHRGHMLKWDEDIIRAVPRNEWVTVGQDYCRVITVPFLKKIWLIDLDEIIDS